jgi:hypothetical protein
MLIIWRNFITKLHKGKIIYTLINKMKNSHQMNLIIILLFKKKNKELLMTIKEKGNKDMKKVINLKITITIIEDIEIEEVVIEIDLRMYLLVSM